MKIIVAILIVLACIVVLLLLLALFVKKEYRVKKEILINKPLSTVFDFIKFLKNQSKFSVWASMDPNMKTEFRGIDGTKGFVSAWDSENKNVGKGEQEILKVTEGEKVDHVVRFIKPFEGTSYSSMSTSSIGDNQTRVTWEFHSKMKYPTNLMLIFMNMEKMVGNDLQTGLHNLRTLLEK